MRLVAAAGRSLGRGDGSRPGRVPRPAAGAGPPGAGLVRAWRRCRWRDGRRPPMPIPARSASVGTRMRGRDGAALPVRLAHLVPGTRRAPLRPAPPARGLHAEGRSAIYGYFAMPVLDGHAHRRPRRPGPARRGAGGQAGDAAASRRGGGRWRAARGGGGVVGRAARVRRRAVEPVSARADVSATGRRVPARRRRAMPAALASAGGALGDPLERRDVAAVGPRLGRVVEHELVEAELGVRRRRARRTGRATSMTGSVGVHNSDPCRCSTGPGRPPCRPRRGAGAVA